MYVEGCLFGAYTLVNEYFNTHQSVIWSHCHSFCNEKIFGTINSLYQIFPSREIGKSHYEYDWNKWNNNIKKYEKDINKYLFRQQNIKTYKINEKI